MTEAKQISSEPLKNEEAKLLLWASPDIRGLFLGFLLISFALGATRLLLPFAILETEGADALISLSSAWFALGQLLTYLLLSRFLRSTGGLTASILIFASCFLGMVTASPSPDILAFARVFEGVAVGLMFLLAIKISKTHSNREAEVVGGLLGGIFIGLALGQGLAGVLETFAESGAGLSRLMAIRTVFLTTSVFSLAGMGLLVFSTRMQRLDPEPNDQRAGHAHFSQVLHYFAIPGFLMLGLVYILYDFSHGLYTPTLSVMFHANGISLEELGIAYLVGDLTWGVIQIISGRLVDRVGPVLPLIGSLALKGVLVLLYPQADVLLMAASLLLVAGAAEGVLEPARNKKAMEVEGAETMEHSHRHWNIAFGPTTGFEISQHIHNHRHQSAVEDAVALLQAMGIVSFAAGSLLGALLLSMGNDFVFLTQLGGIVLIAAAIPLLVPWHRQNSKQRT
jgi:MFS family permease